MVTRKHRAGRRPAMSLCPEKCDPGKVGLCEGFSVHRSFLYFAFERRVTTCYVASLGNFWMWGGTHLPSYFSLYIVHSCSSCCPCPRHPPWQNIGCFLEVLRFHAGGGVRARHGNVCGDKNVRGLLVARWEDRRCLSRGEPSAFFLFCMERSAFWLHREHGLELKSFVIQRCHDVMFLGKYTPKTINTPLGHRKGKLCFALLCFARGFKHLGTNVSCITSYCQV